MGGIGSGRHASRAGKRKAEESMPLDIRRLARAGVLKIGSDTVWQWSTGGRVHDTIRIRSAPGAVILSNTDVPRDQAPVPVEQHIQLAATPCTFGGQRPWFTCPACWRRVAVIYGAGRRFACRRCKNLTYESQAQRDGYSALNQAERIRKRLGWPAGIANPPGTKPRGMHWRTYWRLRAAHDQWVLLALDDAARRLGNMQQALVAAGRALDRR